MPNKMSIGVFLKWASFVYFCLFLVKISILKIEISIDGVCLGFEPGAARW